MKIVVIDGQGGRLGKLLVEAVKDRFPQAEVNSCGVSVAGTQEMGLAGYVKLAADQAEAFLRGAR